jgi:hypothetical protein
MSRAAVKEILGEIQLLNDAERLALDRALARRLEQEWKREAGEARKAARRRGIDQAAIDIT